ncbi:hypothetical protein LOK49_LG02G03152 [Camellia lanceoleosa]|uniref:Uncharacterized protein n=1 Tax=Camellia lanceoleosa TaxID=1840588 RepID=A0ACC0IW92_9ERIC|nr:hypothetical protein LOK49_LG02G03152 [Camellia lanceoleosa]
MRCEEASRCWDLHLQWLDDAHEEDGVAPRAKMNQQRKQERLSAKDAVMNSIFVSSYAMNFDYHALEGYDLVLYSDFSLVDVMEDTDNDNYFAPAANNFSATRLIVAGSMLDEPSGSKATIPPTCGQAMEVLDMTSILPTCLYVYSSKVLNYKKQSRI